MDSFAFQSFLLVRSCAEHDFSESVVVSNFFCHYSLCCHTVYERWQDKSQTEKRKNANSKKGFHCYD